MEGISDSFLTSGCYGYSLIYALQKRGRTNIDTECRKVHHPDMEYNRNEKCKMFI